jgi:hypothetical protein
MSFGLVGLKCCGAVRHHPLSEVFVQACAGLLLAGEGLSALLSFLRVLSFIVSVMITYPILGCLGVTFAPAMPRPAHVDSQAFESAWQEG